uniref:ABC1 atypical kinase-like domain-containing protein n=1 Tax=viral metagenome TaxID=1070528 RepID=A0A6C0KYC3_9ZZZZ
MFCNLTTTIKSLFFIGDIFFFTLYELMHYMIYKNYKNSIYRITSQLAKKNILYVKMFQAFALNNNIIDDSINQEIIKYSDSVPYHINDIDWRTFDKIIEKYDLEDNVGYSSIKSGMISIVFKLKKKNSDDFLILKMKRRNIDQTLDDAIERIKFLVWVLSFFPIFNTLEVPLLFNKNIVILKEQLDFNMEINNTIEMKEVCKNNTYIKIPYIYEEVTRLYPNSILMEFIEGKHISDIDPEDYYDFAKLVVKYGCVNMSCHGMFHGDLHSGNILFIKNNKDQEILCGHKYQLGIIDFGIVMRIDEKSKHKLVSLFSELVISKPREISIKLIDMLLEPKGFIDELHIEDKNNIINIIENIVSCIIEKSKKEFQTLIFDFIFNLNNYLDNKELKKYGIKINEEFIKIQMGITMAYGISMLLCKDNYMDVVNEVLNEVFHLDVLTELLDSNYIDE